MRVIILALAITAAACSLKVDRTSTAFECDPGGTCPDGFTCVEPGLSIGLSDGSWWPAPAQCVQYKSLVIPQVGAP